MHTYTLITGASSGIGRAFAWACAEQGRNLVITARSEDKLSRLAAQLRERYPVDVRVTALDLAEPDAPQALYDKICGEQLTVDTLINNAGFAEKGLFSTLGLEGQRRELALNAAALTELTYFLIRDMAARGSGVIINIASAAAFNPLPYSAVYAATKAYVLSLSQALSYEYHSRGVQVLAVCPGATDTHFFDRFPPATQHLRRPEEVVQTTFRALRRGKSVCTDGWFCKAQSALHRLAPRSLALCLMGGTGERTWGGNTK